MRVLAFGLRLARRGAVAQLGELLICIQEVESSSLFSSTTWLCSSAGRAFGSYPIGREFKSPRSHHFIWTVSSMVRALGS